MLKCGLHLYQLKHSFPWLASSMPPIGFQRVTRGINIPHEYTNHTNFNFKNERKRRQGYGHRPRSGNSVLHMSMCPDGKYNHANTFRNGFGAEPVGLIGHPASTALGTCSKSWVCLDRVLPVAHNAPQSLSSVCLSPDRVRWAGHRRRQRAAYVPRRLRAYVMVQWFAARLLIFLPRGR